MSFISLIEQEVNGAANKLATRPNWHFIEVNIRRIFPKHNRKAFNDAFNVVAQRVTRSGFYLADEPIDWHCFQNVRLYHRRPTEMVPRKCTCPFNLKGNRSDLCSIGLPYKRAPKAQPVVSEELPDLDV